MFSEIKSSQASGSKTQYLGDQQKTKSKIHEKLYYSKRSSGYHKCEINNYYKKKKKTSSNFFIHSEIGLL